MSIGGRFGFHDCGETANTQIALFDYQPAPLICEVRNLSVTKGVAPMGKFRNQNRGVVIDCEGGYFAGDASGGTLFDSAGKKIKHIPDDGGSKLLETAHLSNFIAAVRSRQNSDLAAEALEGHRSAACCHMANVSHRLGKLSTPEAIRATVEGNSELADAFDRCREYLRKNGVDLAVTPAALGPWVTFDPKEERFVQDFADAANKLSRREYRRSFCRARDHMMTPPSTRLFGPVATGRATLPALPMDRRRGPRISYHAPSRRLEWESHCPFVVGRSIT